MSSWLDEVIRDAIRRGEFDNLPHQGEPLKLDDDPHTPEHLRLAHKLLKDNDMTPDWIAEGKALDAARERWLRDLRRAVQRRKPTNENDRAWAAALADLRAAAEAFNRRVLTYNLKVPTGVVHKFALDVEREIQRAAAAGENAK